MYEIVDYDTLYKPLSTKGDELVNARYVKLPVKPMGKGLRALLKHRNGTAIFGIWCLLLEAATDQKPENRGKLLNHKDEPASLEEIADSISHLGKEKLVEESLSHLAEIGWLRSVVTTEEVRSDSVVDTELVPPKWSEEKRSEVEIKEKHLDYVFLYPKEHQSLVERFGEAKTRLLIENLNNYVGSKGKQYKSHYHTILTWENRNAVKGGSDGKTKLYPIAGKTCYRQGCGLPAVYKKSGEYDSYWCGEHMPASVKEKYSA